jgi:hypothetical protein
MRSVPAAAVLIALAALAGTWSWSASNAPAATPPPAAATPNGVSSDSDAAARHAKRTACINQARAKKLVGAQKTAYIKGCIGAP